MYCDIFLCIGGDSCAYIGSVSFVYWGDSLSGSCVYWGGSCVYWGGSCVYWGGSCVYWGGSGGVFVLLGVIIVHWGYSCVLRYMSVIRVYCSSLLGDDSCVLGRFLYCWRRFLIMYWGRFCACIGGDSVHVLGVFLLFIKKMFVCIGDNSCLLGWVGDSWSRGVSSGCHTGF